MWFQLVFFIRITYISLEVVFGLAFCVQRSPSKCFLLVNCPLIVGLPALVVIITAAADWEAYNNKKLLVNTTSKIGLYAYVCFWILVNINLFKKLNYQNLL